MSKKTILITGAARGIGASIAKKMAAENYNIVINYLTSEKKAQELKQELETTYHVEVMTLNADISNEIEVQNMVETIIAKFNTIDCLVNNAAITLDNYFYDKTAEEFQKVINTNLIGPFLTCKYVGIQMLKNKKGKIINIASTNGIDTNETYSMDYDASKAGLISLTHNFAASLAPFVTVNAIAPGWTKTASVLEMNPTYLQEEKEKILLNRFAEPEEIANVVAFLASDNASYINSSVIRVDGGLK